MMVMPAKSAAVLAAMTCGAAVLFSLPPNTKQRPHKICEVPKLGAGSAVTVEGKGQYNSEGLILFDKSCTLIRRRGTRIPTAIQVTINTYKSAEVRAAFYRLDKSDSSPIHSFIVHGIVECATDMQFVFADDGKEVVAANAFGKLGLFKCRMQSARLDAIGSIGKD